MEQRPAPEVTVRDPARPERAADDVVAGHQPPASSRTRVTAAAALLVLVAGVAGALLVPERQHEAAEEQRPTSVVDLRLSSGDASASGNYDEQTDTATLELLLPVRNNGPRPVTVLSGGVGGYGLARPVELPPGARRLLLLNQTLDCSDVSEIPQQDGTVELSVRTTAGVPPRRVQLLVLIPFPDVRAHRVCR